ncbi:Uncharacterised protein [Halioglobus japonicus]|nr:Uncharacterised protein [Halioglobus japonicus]
MKEIIVWLVHTPAGTVGLIAAAVALFSKKGAALHRKAGTYFTVSMLVMLIAGLVAGLLIGSPGDMLLSAVVMYTVFTAWLTVHHKVNGTGFLEQVALAWIVAVAMAAFFLNAVWREAGTQNIYLFWVGFAVFCALGDLRNLYRAGLSGIQRVIRHVWRLGFSLIWTVLALTDKIVKTLGSNVKELPEEQLLYIVGIPTILMLLLILFWIINILFFSRKKYAGYGH